MNTYNDFNNYNFNDYELESVNEAHMPVLILADTSGSMSGTPIINLNKAINRFSADVCRDPRAASQVDVAVMGFNHATNVQQDWRPVNKLDPVSFNAGGGTNLGDALEKGVEMLRKQGHRYANEGIETRMPYMILISDGYGGDVSRAAELIRKRTDERKMRLWVLAVKGYDKATIAQLTDGKRVFELRDEDGFDFTEFFDFMAASVKAVSTSSPDQQVHIDTKIGTEGSNCKVPDLDAWLND
ncbi:MAG: VWA domain-containing protein [Ruminococcus sp.]|nr:VWA domain-containing protein [Ruminococcus sp.]